MSDTPDRAGGRPGAAGRRSVLVLAAGVGAAAGFLSGLFGVGGGILVVPGLVLVAGMAQRLAHGTSLAAITPIALASVVGYALDGHVDWAAALCIAAGAMVGAVIGTHALHAMPQHVLRLTFAVLLVLTAARMFVHEGEALGRGSLDVAMVVGLVVLGLAAGVLSGLLGVGGGIIMVPVMVIGFGIPTVVAKGTSLAVIVPTSIVGTWRNWRLDNVRLDIAAVVGAAGVVTGFLGARVSTGMSDELSAALFGGLLLVVAAQMMLTDLRARRAGDAPER